jgi:hypothetical protein
MPRQAGACLSSQTLGIRVSRSVFKLHCRRSAPSEMQFKSSASFHAEKFGQQSACLPSLVSKSKQSLVAQQSTKVQGHSAGCNAAANRNASRSQWVAGASRRLKSQSVRAAEYAGYLSVGRYAGAFASRWKSPSLRGKAACFALLPNPSINRTANGGPRLLALASAQPPLSAGYLKR